MTSEFAPPHEVDSIAALLPAALAAARTPSDRTASASAAVRRALGASAYTLASCHDAVVAGIDPEAVHDARIATRRLRANLATLSPLLPADRVGELRSELAWLGAAFGRVRDADVLLDRLARWTAALDPKDARGANRLLATVRGTRTEGQSALLEALASPRYLATVAGSIGFAEASPLAEPDVLARLALPPLMRSEWRRLKRACERLGPTSSDERLHRGRIAAKRARYAAEAFAPVFGRRARVFAKRAKALQEILGAHQDAVVAREWLRERAEESSVVAFAAGQIAAAEAAELERTREAWPRAWRALSVKEHRFW